MPNHNDDYPTKQWIRNHAYQLFYENGIEKTSYTLIAKACDLGRPLVQHHFPYKRSLGVDLIQDMNALCIEKIKQTAPPVSESVEQQPVYETLRALQLYLNVLCFNDSMRRLTKDMLSSRDLSESIIDANLELAVPAFDDFLTDDKVALMIPAVESCYGQLYRSLASGETIAFNYLTRQCVATYLVYCENEDYNKADNELSAHLMGDDQVRNLARSVLGTLFEISE